MNEKTVNIIFSILIIIAISLFFFVETSKDFLLIIELGGIMVN